MEFNINVHIINHPVVTNWGFLERWKSTAAALL